MSIPIAPKAHPNAGPTDTGRDEILFQSERTRIFRRRLPDGAGWVVCKEPLGPDAIQRLRHEQKTLQQLAGTAGVPQLSTDIAPANAMAFEYWGEGVRAETLRGQFAIPDLLAMALQLARIVAGVHRAGIIHKDINPANILIDGERAVLIDFDLATSFAEDRPSFIPADEIAGTLAYLSPEQTGRTGRAVDQRADLYALGATLYDLATGRPPFADQNRLQLIHDHLARIPVPPIDLEPTIPALLSMIIMRLLEKEPDQRYQSADGLAYDLRRLSEMYARGEAAIFPLGAHDFPLRLRPPSRLVGRTAEADALRSAFDKALHNVGCVLVAGPAGVGKSALINELRPVAAGRRGWFVAGKCDQYRQDMPADCIGQVFRALFRLVLAEPEAKLNALREQALQVIGPNAGLLSTAIPEFASSFGIAPLEIAGDPIQTAARLSQAAVNLLRVIASPQRPVVIAIDDLQWAIPASLDFIDTVVTAENLPGLLLVGSYRESEVDAAHPLRAMISRWARLNIAPAPLHLHNLPPRDLATLLAEMLRLPPERASELAAAVSARTDGNPFDTVEMINALRHDGALILGEEGWHWDATTIRRFVGKGEVVDLLGARIARLPPTARSLLESMAGLGGRIEIDLLAAASALSRADIEEQLKPSLEDGLLVMESADDFVRFRHDRVQQAAYGRLSFAARNALHLRLARQLGGQTQFMRTAAEQYLSAIDAITDNDERRHAATLLRAAATAARSTINYSMTERLLTAALALLQATGDTANVSLLVELRVDLHTALYSLGRLDEADAVYLSLMDHPVDPVLLVQLGGIQISSLTNRNRLQDGLALGYELLAQLGLERPQYRSEDIKPQLERLRKWIADSGRHLDRSRPEAADPHVTTIAGLINRLMPPASFCDMDGMLWLTLESQRLWDEHGPCASLVASLSCACVLTSALEQDYRTGYDITRHVLAVGAARGYEPETSQAKLLFLVGAQHWFEPLESGIADTRQTHEGLVRGGDLQMACWSYYPAIATSLDCAPSIETCVEEIHAAIEFAVRTGNTHAVGTFATYREMLQILRGEGEASVMDAREIDELASNPLAGGYYHINRALSGALMGHTDDLIVHAAAAIPLLEKFHYHYPVALAYLLQALALAERIRTAADDEREALLAEFDICRDWLARRAQDAPVNFLHLLRWIDAERSWATLDFQGAITGFDTAVFEASQRQRPWHRALIAERAGRFHFAYGLEHTGQLLLAEAWRLYEAWGASAKADEMARRHHFLRSQAGHRRQTDELATSTRFSSGSIDFISILRASQALSSETSFPRLRVRIGEILREMTGATQITGALWYEETKEWRVPSAVEQDNGQSTPIDDAGRAGLLPLTAFNYVARTREPLVVNDVLRDDRFARDPYFAGVERCSLLGVPVFKQGALSLVLLLENRLSRGAFTAERLEAVLLVCGQLGVSLDSVQLYESLERKVAERTDDLTRANLQLEALSTTDPLTGLANRRRFNEMVEQEWQRAIRPGLPIGLAMIDVDHFKLFNDHYGHLGGDECLRRVARVLGESVRGSSDLVARYGGEEFVIVLPGADLEAIRPVAERARAAIEALREPHQKSNSGFVSISIGIAAMVPKGDNDAKQLIELADTALYRAKNNGRNRVESGSAGDLLPAAVLERPKPGALTGAGRQRSSPAAIPAAAMPLRVLIIEDSDFHAELIRVVLERGLNSVVFERVETEDALASALARQDWDIVICDYYLPAFGALRALALVRQLPTYLPFILVSGAIREENAVEAMKLGADDYVMKNNLARLVPAITRELEANETRRRNVAAEKSLRESLLLYRSLADALPTGLYRLDRDGKLLFYNKFMAAIRSDDTESAYIGRSVYDLLADENMSAVARGREEDRKVMEQGVSTTAIEEFAATALQEKRLWEITRIPVWDGSGRIVGLQGVIRDVTQDKRNEAELAFERDLLRNLLTNSPDIIFFMDNDRRFIRVSPSMAARTHLGHPDAFVGMRPEDFLPAPAALEVRKRNDEVLEGGATVTNREDYFIDANGQPAWYSTTEVPIRDELGKITGLVGITRDVTELKEAEQRIQRLNRVYAVLSAVNALIVHAGDRDQLFRGACRIAVDTGKFTSAYIAMLDHDAEDIRLVASSTDDASVVTRLQELLSDMPNPTTPEMQAVHARLLVQRRPRVWNDVDGEVPAHVRANSVTEGNFSTAVIPLVVDGETVGLLGLNASETGFFDAEEMKLLLQLAGDISLAIDHLDKGEKLAYLAYYDPLTGLANARLFRERLGEHVIAVGSETRPLALALLDVERFKSVNDALGREAGDTLLQQLAERLTRCTDSLEQIAHLGVDHFALMFPMPRDEDNIARLIEDLVRSCFDEPFLLGGNEVKAAAKVGIALFPSDGAEAEALFRNAESALKKAKTVGESYLFYSTEMNARVAEHLALESRLRRALEREEFVLHYQPKVAATTGEIVGVEALIRWQDPITGLVPPSDFIPLMEETGLILEVGAWALKQAVQDQAAWRAAGLAAPRIAVNVSAIQLRQSNFVDTVVRAISLGPSPPMIDLEITESLIMEDVSGNIAKLNAIRDLGLSIAIDDFGTGYSSLAYLARLPVHLLKIDRSFVITMLHDVNTMTLVSTMISLAHSLGLKVVAEGVDEEAQAVTLRSLGCDEIQGFLYGRASAADEIATSFLIDAT